MEGIFEFEIGTTQDCPPTPTSNSDALGGVTWSDVRAALDVVGCRSNTAVDSAIERARTRGVEPSEALAIVEHAQRCVHGDAGDEIAAWGPGAVLHRLAQQRPGDEIGDYWPAPDPRFVAAERRAKINLAAMQESAAKAREATAQAERDAAFDAETAELEAALGEELDAMSDDERRWLWGRQRSSTRYKLATRPLLLRVLHRERTQPVFRSVSKSGPQPSTLHPQPAEAR